MRGVHVDVDPVKEVGERARLEIGELERVGHEVVAAGRGEVVEDLDLAEFAGFAVRDFGLDVLGQTEVEGPGLAHVVGHVATEGVGVPPHLTGVRHQALLAHAFRVVAQSDARGKNVANGLDAALARHVEEAVKARARRHPQAPFVGRLKAAQRVGEEGRGVRRDLHLRHVQSVERIELIVGECGGNRNKTNT